MWNLVVNDLIEELNANGYYCQGYADDLVIVVLGKYMNTVRTLAQCALNIVEKWCKKQDLGVNPKKTVIVPFTKKHIQDEYWKLELSGETIPVKGAVKYLGVILDAKLHWTPHIKSICAKAKSALLSTRRACGKKLGFKSHTGSTLV